jgi:hypothetical protein
MRLRLVIQRHCLPAVNLLWDTSGPRPHSGQSVDSHTSLGGTSTIAQLLEQINDVIPLESEEWGLEDYVVEVEGFECLHFWNVEGLLKEGDRLS